MHLVILLSLASVLARPTVKPYVGRDGFVVLIDIKTGEPACVRQYGAHGEVKFVEYK